MTMEANLTHEGHVQVAPEGTGKYVRNLTVLDELPDGTLVLKHMQVVVAVDAARGDPIDFKAMTSVLGEIRDLLRDLKEIAERGFP